MAQKIASLISRRRFLKAAGATALAVGAGPAIIIPGRAQPKTLKILHPKEFSASYNQWLGEYAKAWGEKNDIRVILDWVKMSNMQSVREEEAAAQQGHDILHNTAEFEDQVIDHRELYEEAEQHYGKVLDLALKRSYNPKTGKFYGFGIGYNPHVVVYRKDLWDSVSMLPDSWENIRLGGRRIKFVREHPVGLGLGPNLDCQANLRSLLFSFGGSVQDADHQPALKSPQTLESLKFVKALFEEAMSEEVLTWDNTTFNNRAMLAGDISLALNPISITRTAENKRLPVNDKLWLAEMPRGPAGRFGQAGGVRTMAIWKFAHNIESAQKFLVDWVGDFRQAFLTGQFYFFPTFPQTVPDLAELLANDPQANPPGKYRALAQAQDWNVMIGHPGYTNAPTVDIYYNTSLIPTMFAQAATGKMTPEEALTQADQEVRRIFEKWRERGKV